MKKVKPSIAEVADNLREQKDLPLWSLASSSTIQAIAKGQQELFGSRGRLLNRLFLFTGVGWIGLQALRCIAGGVVTLWWIKSLAVARAAVIPAELFIGFGAGPEEQMFASFAAEASRLVAHLDQTRPPSFAMIVRPSLLKLWRHTWREADIAIEGLANSGIPVVRDHCVEWLTSISIRISVYVFFKTWAEQLPKETRRLVFIAPDIPAIAIIDAKKLTSTYFVEFWQHGLLERSLLLPKFDKVLALNKPDAVHVGITSGCLEVTITQARLRNESREKNSILLFASIYECGSFAKLDHLEVLKEAFAWATGQGLRIIVRPHPREKDGFWQEHFPEILIDRTGGRLDEYLILLKPKLVMSWFSTSLIDALKLGAIPVLIVQGSEEDLGNMVFPLGRIATRWPADKLLLEELIINYEIYHEQVLIRQEEAF